MIFKEPFQQRVVTEQTELDAKINSLIAFLRTPEFEKLDTPEQVRLRKQLASMQDYSTILIERIAAFPK